MLKESYNYQGDTLLEIEEPAVVCGQKSSSDRWNPNVPFIGTQEQWWEHFHEIEKGEFMAWEEHKKKFNVWKMEYLASVM